MSDMQRFQSTRRLSRAGTNRSRLLSVQIWLTAAAWPHAGFQ
jgi:hypothetical protein